MTTTTPDALVVLDVDLDLEVPCRWEPCDIPAVWGNRCPFCKQLSTVCDKHRARIDAYVEAASVFGADVFRCSVCLGGPIPAPLRWFPL